MVAVVVAVTSDVSVHTIVIVGCVCGALVVLLGIVLAVVCYRRRHLMKSTNIGTFYLLVTQLVNFNFYRLLLSLHPTKR